MCYTQGQKAILVIPRLRIGAVEQASKRWGGDIFRLFSSYFLEMGIAPSMRDGMENETRKGGREEADGERFGGDL
jgi:hypothetical protein